MFAGEFGIIDRAMRPMKGVTTEAAMTYKRRLGTLRVYMPTIKKRVSETTVEKLVSGYLRCEDSPSKSVVDTLKKKHLPDLGISTSRTCRFVNPKERYMMLPKVVIPLREKSDRNSFTKRTAKVFSYSPVRNGRQESVEGTKVQHRIFESLSNLGPDPFLSSNVSASLVLDDTRCCHALFIFAQPEDFGRTAKESKASKRQNNCARAQKHGDGPPGCKTSAFVSVGPDAVHDQRSNDVEAGVGGLPEEGP